MAITIRNKETEELIRKIGRRTGEGPSAVILRLAQGEVSGEAANTVSDEEFQRRIAFMDDLHRRFPPPDPKPTWEEIQAEIDDLYSYLDEEGGEGHPMEKR